MTETSQSTYIYALVDPFSMEIRYIGWTANPSQRLTSHISESRQKKKHCHHWIQQILMQGGKPIMQIIEEISPDDFAEMERHWIKYCRSLGIPLTNISEGGEKAQGYIHPGEPKKHQANFRLPTITLSQLESIRQKTGMTQVQVLILAIEKLHSEKVKEG